MFGFLIKKSFFDMWDNLIAVFLLNFGYILVFFISSGTFYLLEAFPEMNDVVKAILSVMIFFILFWLYNGPANGMARDMVDNKKPGFKDFFNHFKASFKMSLIYGVISGAVLIILFFLITFYMGIENFFGAIAFAFLFWGGIIWVTATQYVFPIYCGLDKKFFKIFKKSFLIFFDNPVFTFGLLIGSIVTLAVSIPLFLMLPGIFTIQIWLNAGLKLRLYKYDYIEEHGENARMKIPWDSLLVADKEKVGKRTLKGMIFPWKE
ncbi:MAG: hypothetical protein JW969_17920 [Spirochaetales bacterium]|nr:hypothetical protein [Spirochaetales bacterium]